MHIFTFTTCLLNGEKQTIKIPAADIRLALDLTKSLRNKGVEFTHVFWD